MMRLLARMLNPTSHEPEHSRMRTSLTLALTVLALALPTAAQASYGTGSYGTGHYAHHHAHPHFRLR